MFKSLVGFLNMCVDDTQCVTKQQAMISGYGSTLCSLVPRPCFIKVMGVKNFSPRNFNKTGPGNEAILCREDGIKQAKELIVC